LRQRRARARFAAASARFIAREVERRDAVRRAADLRLARRVFLRFAFAFVLRFALRRFIAGLRAAAFRFARRRFFGAALRLAAFFRFGAALRFLAAFFLLAIFISSALMLMQRRKTNDVS